ncbi:hypothetical protein CEXT_581501 [Caerostris extrusa]|uniref:Uncharacterized protein n=1 Tax=Caerostris extrusa TaxID=172846 RepID=A0AAV4S2L1_CAEEX|nr:hypothetical protein CEXT_581501 [Caerostris extrusa]
MRESIREHTSMRTHAFKTPGQFCRTDASRTKSRSNSSHQKAPLIHGVRSKLCVLTSWRCWKLSRNFSKSHEVHGVKFEAPTLSSGVLVRDGFVLVSCLRMR